MESELIQLFFFHIFISIEKRLLWSSDSDLTRTSHVRYGDIENWKPVVGERQEGMELVRKTIGAVAETALHIDVAVSAATHKSINHTINRIETVFMARLDPQPFSSSMAPDFLGIDERN